MAYVIDFLVSYDDESLAEELRRVAKVLGKQTLTWSDINKHGRVSAYTVRRKFGSVGRAHEAAGLVPPKRRPSDDEVLKMLADLWTITSEESGRSPSALELKKYRCPVSMTSIIRRFGSWNKALLAAAAAKPGGRKQAGGAPKVKKAAAGRKPISIRKRFEVFKRDGYKCSICRRVGGELELDHVIPVCRGGNSNMNNLQTLCRKCNRGKGGELE
jgi:hypothetical protein